MTFKSPACDILNERLVDRLGLLYVLRETKKSSTFAVCDGREFFGACFSRGCALICHVGELRSSRNLQHAAGVHKTSAEPEGSFFPRPSHARAFQIRIETPVAHPPTSVWPNRAQLHCMDCRSNKLDTWSCLAAQTCVAT